MLGRGIAYLATAAGKADLTGMVAQMGGTLGQQHRRAGAAHDHGNQDGGGGKLAIGVAEGSFGDRGRDEALAESTPHEREQASARIRGCVFQ
jgi:hypothetical protein